MRREKPPFFYRLIRRIVDLVYPKITLEGMERLPETPYILVGNHAQTNGPIISVVRLPFAHYTWCASQMLNRKEVAAYAYADFWSKKPKAIRWVYWLVSRLIPDLAVCLMRNSDTIPVYHDSRCITTFKRSVEKLQEGYPLVIFPEHDSPHNAIVYDFQDRFIDVARLYYRKTEKPLAFVPMYLAPKLKKVFFGEPILFDPNAPAAEERRRICTYLMQTITEIAQAQPLHTVVPYANIPKRDYPKNRSCEVIRDEAKSI